MILFGRKLVRNGPPVHVGRLLRAVAIPFLTYWANNGRINDVDWRA